MTTSVNLINQSYLKNNLNKVDISTVQDIIDTADKAILL